MSILTYNVKLNIEDESMRDYWFNLLEQTQLIYNDCAKLIVNNCTKLGLQDVHSVCYNYCRKNYPNIPAQLIIKTYKDVLANIRSIRKNKHKKPSIPTKKNLSSNLDKRMYSCLTENSIKISSGQKSKRTKVYFIRYQKFNEMSKQYIMKDPLIFIKGGIIYLSIRFDVPDKPIQSEEAIGIDIGMKRFITTSDGLVLRDKQYNNKRRKIRYLKQKLKEKNTKSSKRHLEKIKHKERNLSKSYVHSVVNEVIKNKADIFVLEDLSNIKQSTSKTREGFKRKRHNNRFSQIPIYKFKEILTYKAQLIGKKVETVSPKYTSQIDCTTGKRDGERKGCRYYCKKNKVVLDADWNAAINIVKRSKHSFSYKVPIDGCLYLKDRLLSTSQSSIVSNNRQATNSLG